MLCKYYLQLGTDTVNTESPDCIDVSEMIKNLDAIKVSYSRVDFGGVVRKCGSSIEFTGKAREALIAHYEENYLQSSGVFAVYMADNNWNYSKVWECPLDFATLQYDANVFTIGCVDNSAAAIIKANKKSKYEFDATTLKESGQLLYNGVMTGRDFAFKVAFEEQIEGGTRTYSDFHFYKDYYSFKFPQINITSEGFISENITLRNQSRYAWSIGGEDEGQQVAMSCRMSNDYAGFVVCNHRCTIRLCVDVTLSWERDESVSFEYYRDCYFIVVAGTTVVWRQRATGTVEQIHIDIIINLNEGDCVAFAITTRNKATLIDGSPGVADATYNLGLRLMDNTQTSYVFETEYQNNPISIDVIKPVNLLNALAGRMFADKSNMHVECAIEGNADLLSRTLLVAAESVRRIPNRRLYSSFADFCEFMEAVFGYVYTIDSSENEQAVRLTFRHRSSVFKDDVIKRLSRVKNLSYMIDEGLIYSGVEVGYPSVDYDNGNSAMDEFNFTNHYNTGVDIADNILSLISPYRADCFGIEELLVKNSSDGNSDKEATRGDKDIFIVIAVSAEPQNGIWNIDRFVTIQNVVPAETMFNAAIAPNKIVKNNEGYIGCFTNLLKFTASDGNSGAVIGGTSMSANINIAKQLFKAGKISVDTDDYDFPENWDGIIELEYAGKTYKGYLDSIDICLAKPGTITYNLIEKCIE